MKKLLLLVLGFFYSVTLLANEVTVQSTTLSDDKDSGHKYSIATHYPQISGAQLSSAEQGFNAAVKQIINERVEAFKKNVKSWNTSRLPADLKAAGSSLAIDYDMTSVQPNLLLSARFSEDVSMEGAAHPSHEFFSLNYDLKNNKVLMLSDVFKQNSNYLAQLSAFAQEKLLPQLGQSLFKEGLTPDAKNFSVWNVDQNGLKLTFNNYQVAAYVFGPQQVVLPYSYLKDKFADDSVLQCLKDKRCHITTIKKV